LHHNHFSDIGIPVLDFAHRIAGVYAGLPTRLARCTFDGARGYRRTDC
jgi:hypothetical protein